MKSTGVVRKLDALGRIVLPIEIRHTLAIDNEPLEIFVEDETIILRKYQPACMFCGDAKDVLEYKGKKICQTCYKEMKKKLD